MVKVIDRRGACGDGVLIGESEPGLVEVVPKEPAKGALGDVHASDPDVTVPPEVHCVDDAADGVASALASQEPHAPSISPYDKPEEPPRWEPEGVLLAMFLQWLAENRPTRTELRSLSQRDIFDNVLNIGNTFLMHHTRELNKARAAERAARADNA